MERYFCRVWADLVATGMPTTAYKRLSRNPTDISYVVLRWVQSVIAQLLKYSLVVALIVLVISKKCQI